MDVDLPLPQTYLNFLSLHLDFTTSSHNFVWRWHCFDNLTLYSKFSTLLFQSVFSYISSKWLFYFCCILILVDGIFSVDLIAFFWSDAVCFVHLSVKKLLHRGCKIILHQLILHNSTINSKPPNIRWKNWGGGGVSSCWNSMYIITLRVYLMIGYFKMRINYKHLFLNFLP